MSVLTVPRSIANSCLKNFSMNFMATVPPPKWQGPGSKVNPKLHLATCMPEIKVNCVGGIVFEFSRRRLDEGFQFVRHLVVRIFLTYYFEAFVQDDVVVSRD